MAIDTASQHFKFLLKQIQKGNVFLFAGAGFSLGAHNSTGREPPTGDTLAALLAAECGWPYSGEDLPTVYGLARTALGQGGLLGFLAKHFKNCKPGWQPLISSIPWYRIYTANIDDVIEVSYGGPAAFQKLKSLTYPTEYAEADPLYGTVQCMHLHGSVLDTSKKLTFTLEDFADQTININPWYQALIDDMQAKSGVFVGTRLNDTPFYYYLNMRERNAPGGSRAKSYLVSPGVSQIRRRQLEQRNFEVFDATAEEFFTVLSMEVRALIPTQLDLLGNIRPDLIESIRSGLSDLNSSFLQQFELIRDVPAPKPEKASPAFFDGAEPTWRDIYNEWDANRRSIEKFVNQLKLAQGGVRAIVLVGHAGGGKSTALKRAAVELAKGGHTVYYCREIENLDRKSLIRTLTLAAGRHLYVLFDNAVAYIDQIDTLSGDLGPDVNVTFVLAERSHVIYPRIAQLRVLKPELAELGDLVKEDCIAVIQKLTLAGRLGKLNGKPLSHQVNEFMIRSKKQLLVALKEATLSDGFSRILANEYNELASDGAKFIYAIASLAYMHGTPVKRRHLRACIEGTDVEKTAILDYNLKDVIVPWRERGELLCPRHALIAREVALKVASEDVKVQAIVTFLSQISSEVTPKNISNRVPEYLAYRGIINFDNLRELFGDTREKIIAIYDELKHFYSSDFLFWLQMGRCEVYFDQFDTAENYIEQSLSLKTKDNFQAIHQKGTLLLKRAVFRETRAAALEDARRGEELLLEQIRERGEQDSYPYCALFNHKIAFLRTHPIDTKLNELKRLVELAAVASKRHTFDEQLKAAVEAVRREYLMQAVEQ